MCRCFIQQAFLTKVLAPTLVGPIHEWPRRGLLGNSQRVAMMLRRVIW
jgi:hypothetical protein